MKGFAGVVLMVLAVAIGVGGWRWGKGENEEDIRGLFEKWVGEHGRAYADTEKTYRFMVFRQNYLMIQQHNKQHQQGIYSFSMAVNKFADLTLQQYSATHLTRMDTKDKSITSGCYGLLADNTNPLTSWDWANRATTAVQNQGSCSASWAFSATGALQGAYALARGRILKVSDQQIIDCSTNYGNNGCNGGFMDQAFWYVIDNGITLYENYPYNAKSSRCIYKSSLKYYRITECIDITPKNYSKLITAVLHAPVAVAIDATNFRFYNDGVYDKPCDTSLNRGMLLVGYGTLDDKDYWKLKNSQGMDWGRSGYMLLKREKADGNGWCGVQMAGYLPNGVVL